jgi:AcrR family transcriptional regulator
MGTAERREREKEQRKSDILDAAEKVFFSRGVSTATMEEIAEAAELSKGTLYLYFKSKEDIYLGISMRAMTRLREMFIEATQGEGSGIEKLRAIGEAYHRFSQVYPDYFNAMIHFEAEELDLRDEESLACECQRTGECLLRVVADVIEEGINDGTIRSSADPLRTAVLLYAQTDGVIRVLARKGERMREFCDLDTDGLMQDFFRFVFFALNPEGQLSGDRGSAGSGAGAGDDQTHGGE